MIPIAVAFFKVHPAKKEKSQKTFSQRPSNTCRTQAIQRLLVQGNPRSYRCLPIVRRPCPLTFAIDKNIFPSPSPFPSRGRGIGNLIPRPVSSGKCGFWELCTGATALVAADGFVRGVVRAVFAFVRRQDGGSPCGGRRATTLPWRRVEGAARF